MLQKLPYDFWLSFQCPLYLNESIHIVFSSECTISMKDVLYLIATPAPGMMHIMEKPAQCGNFDSYQMPEGFPVGMFPFLWPLRLK